MKLHRFIGEYNLSKDEIKIINPEIIKQIKAVLRFEIGEGKNSQEKIIFHLIDESYKPNKNSKNVSIFIGHEGGFTDKEIEIAKNLDYTIASLGSLTLRGETAAIVATYRVVNNI